jgi:hypothetical protein
MCLKLTLAVCLALMAVSGDAALADPIVATAYMTIGSDPYIGGQTWSGSTTIANPSDPNLGIMGVDHSPVDINITTSPIPTVTSASTRMTPVGLI